MFIGVIINSTNLKECLEMTKRLFAIALAAIIAIAMFTFPASAAGTATATLTKDGTKLVLTFTPGEDMDANKVVINYIMGNSIVRTTNVTDMKKTANEYATSKGGSYTAQVIYYDGAMQKGTATSGSVTVPITTNGNNIKVVYDETGIKLEFTAQKDATKYRLDYTYNGRNEQKEITRYQTVDSKVIVDLGKTFDYDKLSSIRVTAYTNKNGYASSSFASWTNSGYNGGGSSGTGNIQVSGPISAQIQGTNIYISWSNQNCSGYRLAYKLNNGSTNYKNCNYATSTTLTYNYSYDYQIEVQGYYNGSWQTFGYAYVPGYNGGIGGGGSGIGGYYGAVQAQGNQVYWSPVQGAIAYLVNFTSNTTGTKSDYVTVPYWTAPVAAGGNYTVQVIAVMNNNQQQYVGIAYVQNGSSLGGGYYPGTGSGSSAGGNVTQGQNCTVTSYPSYATITWNSVGAEGYHVVVTVNEDPSKGYAHQVYNYLNYASINISNQYSYTVAVYPINNAAYPIATATVKAQSGSVNNSGITKTEIKNLTVKSVNSWTTSLTWNKYPNATYYYIMYGALDGTSAQETVAYTTNTTIPFGEATPYQATVYAMNANGRLGTVGYVYNVPGSSASDSSKKDYPSSLKATSSNKRVSLSWTAADGASSYTIYYKRSTASNWNKAGTITKTAVNLNGLTNGTNYQFKVVPNKGSESSIIEIAPSTTSKTVTVPDPTNGDNDITIADDDLSLISVESNSTGKITASWTNVGAASYRVYIAEGTSSSYKYCGTYTGTQATISSFGTGSNAKKFTSGKSYKVRVVRSDYTGSIATALKDCSPITVKVK